MPEASPVLPGDLAPDWLPARLRITTYPVEVQDEVVFFNPKQLMRLCHPYETIDVIDRINGYRRFPRIGGLDMGGRTRLLMVASRMAEARTIVEGDFADVSEPATSYDDHFFFTRTSPRRSTAIANGHLCTTLSRHDCRVPTYGPRGRRRAAASR